MTTDIEALVAQLRAQAEQIAAEGCFGWGNLDTEAADALCSQADRIQALEADKASLHAEIRDWYKATKEWAERSEALEAKCVELEKNDARYQWLRRRCFMIDSSDESAIVLSLFNDEGPTGEFLDDQVDAALAAQAQSKEGS